MGYPPRDRVCVTTSYPQREVGHDLSKGTMSCHFGGYEVGNPYRMPPVNGRERCPGCHSERSEESGSPDAEILRCAQNDRPSPHMFCILALWADAIHWDRHATILQ